MNFGIEKILDARGIVNARAFYGLRDDGDGPYIERWDEAALGPRPTAAEIAQAEATQAVVIAVRAVRGEAERRLAAGIAVNAKPFKADDASVLRMKLLTDGLVGAAAGTTQIFRTAAGDEFTVNAAQAGAISRAQIGYVGAVLAASSDLQANPPTDPTADVHWPAKPSVTI